MYPRLGGIENLDGLVLYNPINAIAVLSVNALIFFLLARRGFRIRDLLPYQIAISAGGFGGAKLFSILFRGRIESLAEELESGWRYPGALLGMLAVAWIARRLLPRGLSWRAYLDAWAPSFAVGCAIGRIACLAHGCCYGSISALPWAIQYPFSSIPWYAHRATGSLAADGFLSAPVHPFPVYLLILESALAIHLLGLRSRSRYAGEVVLRFLAVHGIAKGLLEFTRDPFSWLHLIVLPLGLLAAFVAWTYDRRSLTNPIPSIGAATVP